MFLWYNNYTIMQHEFAKFSQIPGKILGQNLHQTTLFQFLNITTRVFCKNEFTFITTYSFTKRVSHLNKEVMNQFTLKKVLIVGTTLLLAAGWAKAESHFVTAKVTSNTHSLFVNGTAGNSPIVAISPSPCLPAYANSTNQMAG